MRRMRRNTDEHIRRLERRVLEGDLSLVGELARAYERRGAPRIPVRTEPMSVEQIRAAMDKDGVIRGVIRVSLGTIIDLSGEGILDHFSRALTGTELLADLQYRVVDVEHPNENVDDLLIEVSGDARAIVEATSPPEGCDSFCLEHGPTCGGGTFAVGGRRHECHHFRAMHVNSCVPVTRRREIHAARGGHWTPIPPEGTPQHVQGSPVRARSGAEGICACGEAIIEENGFWVHTNADLDWANLDEATQSVFGNHHATPETQGAQEADDDDEETPCDDFCGEHVASCDGNCDHEDHVNQCLGQRRRMEIRRLRGQS